MRPIDADRLVRIINETMWGAMTWGDKATIAEMELFEQIVNSQPTLGVTESMARRVVDRMEDEE